MNQKIEILGIRLSTDLEFVIGQFLDEENAIIGISYQESPFSQQRIDIWLRTAEYSDHREHVGDYTLYHLE